MSKALYNTDIQRVLDSFLLHDPRVVAGKMFGYPAYVVSDKLFACVYENSVGIKVPYQLANELVGWEGITHFTPMGRRKMKEWIQISRDIPEDYLNDLEIFKKSVDYVEMIARSV